MNDCPRCGAKDAAYGDQFCGKCEETYQAGQFAELEEAVLARDGHFASCPAEEGCGTCFRLMANVYRAQGREDLADAILNR